MRVDVAVLERHERHAGVHRARRAAHQDRSRQPLGLVGECRGEVDLLASDEPVARHTAAVASVAREQVGAAHVHLAGDEQLLGREAREDSVAGRRDDHFLLDPGRRAAVGRSAVGLECEDHALLELLRELEGVNARDHRRLVEPDADAVAELEAEAASSSRTRAPPPSARRLRSRRSSCPAGRGRSPRRAIRGTACTRRAGAGRCRRR